MSGMLSLLGRLQAVTHQVLADAKTSTTIATGTLGISFAQVMGWVQANIGFVGTVIGITLTAITAWVQIRTGMNAIIEGEINKIEKEKAKIELEILRRQLADE